jgi:hypothetical protein
MKLSKPLASLVLIALVIATTFGVSSAVNAAPGPVSVPQQVSTTSPKSVIFATSQQITANGRLAVVPLPQYGTLDLQYVVDGAGGANAFTATVEYSNDALNWSRASAAAWSNTTATTGTTDMTRTLLYGSFATVYVSVTNSTPITITVLGLAR